MSPPAVLDVESKDLYHESARQIGAAGYDNDSDGTSATEVFLSTTKDVRDMKRMGKTQELRRNFRRVSSFCFVCVLTATWEFLLIANTNALTDGGRPGLFWTYIWSFVGMGLIFASLAEMSSMAPTSGGQYHWVSEFAPGKYQKALSYTSGWLATLSWQTASASGGPLLGGIIQGLMTIYNPDYPAPAWHLFMFAFANFVFINFFNVYGARLLAPMQNPLMMLHVLALIAVIVVFWTLAPHPSAADVFVHFENSGGWQTTGLALCLGQITPLYVLQCGDCAAHISEEVKEAALNVPRSMFWGYIVNATLGLILCVSYLFAIPSVTDALNDPTTFPFLYVFQQSMPKGGTAALTAIILFLVTASNIAYNASTARQTFAFARDRGLPFSGWIGKVDKRLKIPANAVWFTMTVSILLNLIVLGSTAAFNALMSLTVVALLATYGLSISVMLWRRLYSPEQLPPCSWSLGRYGAAINAISVAYCIFGLFFSFWPMTRSVDLTTFNWAPVMFVGIMAFSIVLYFVQGRHVYEGPVVTVEGFMAERRLEGFGPMKMPKHHGRISPS